MFNYLASNGHLVGGPVGERVRGLVDGRDLGHVDGEHVELRRPRVALLAAVHRPERLPDGAVALEPGAECDLPDPVALPDPALGLAVGELVPERAAGGVAEAAERHPGRLHVPGAELEAALELVQHAAAAGVDAEVVEGELEVGEVGADVGAEDAVEDDGGEEAELLGHGEDERAQRGDVGAQGLAGDEHELLGEGDADAAGVVLLLRDAAEALVVRAAVGAHGVDELVLGPGPVGGAVGEEDGGAADAEERVGDQHRAVVAHVGVEGDVLRAHHQRVRVRVHLQACVRACQFLLPASRNKTHKLLFVHLLLYILAGKLKLYLIRRIVHGKSSKFSAALGMHQTHGDSLLRCMWS
jgi:hypothetical protein